MAESEIVVDVPAIVKVDQNTASQTLQAAQTFACLTPQDYALGIENIKELIRLRDQWKSDCAPAISKAKEAYDAVRALYKNIDDDLDKAEQAYRATCEAWVAEQHAKRQEALQSAVAEVLPSPEGIFERMATAFDQAVEAGDEAKANRLLAQTDLPPEMQETPLPPPPSAPIESFEVPKIGGVSVSVPYTWDLVDETKLPREYMTVDRKKITKLVKALGAQAQKLLGKGVLVRPDTQLRISAK